MISVRGAEVLRGFATDLIVAYGNSAGNLDDADLRQRLTGMTDPSRLGDSPALFDDCLDEAARLLRRLLELAVVDVSWRAGVIEAVRPR